MSKRVCCLCRDRVGQDDVIGTSGLTISEVSSGGNPGELNLFSIVPDHHFKSN